MAAASTPTNTSKLPVITRVLQLACCLLDLYSAAAAFYGGCATSPSVLVLLVGCAGSLYLLWYIVAVDILHTGKRLDLRTAWSADIALLLMLPIANYCVQKCNS